MSRTVTASIGPHYEDFIRNSILSGRYNNASEVIREGLRRLEEDESRLAALRAALDEGEASPDVEDFDPEAFLLEMKAKRNANGARFGITPLTLGRRNKRTSISIV